MGAMSTQSVDMQRFFGVSEHAHASVGMAPGTRFTRRASTAAKRYNPATFIGTDGTGYMESSGEIRIRIAKPQAAFAHPPPILGNNSRIIVMAAGPTSTTKIPGKMNRTSGKMSFTAVLAAFSSAI